MNRKSRCRRMLSVLLAFCLLLCAGIPAQAFTYPNLEFTETITVDGDLSDTGWASAEWTHINGANGTFQNAYEPYPPFAFSYAFRSDDTHLYLAVRLNRPAYLTGKPGQTTSTNLRLWLDASPTDTARTGLFDFSYDGTSCIDTRATKSCDSICALKSDKEETCYEISFLLSDIGYNPALGLTACVTLSDPYAFNNAYDALHSYVYRGGNTNAPWNSTAFYPHIDVEGVRLREVSEPAYRLTGVYGDLDLDGVCGAYDSVLLLQYFAGIQEIPTEVLNMADVNGDGKQDLTDAQMIEQYLSGMTSAFPTECTHPVYTVETNASGEKERVCARCLHRDLLNQTPQKVRVAYLPLDNRPVNKDRVEYLAQSIGIELVMPEEYLYRTALDNMAPNPNGLTLGDRVALLQWMKEVDQTCDYFILSLDQALSGGLVGSRSLCNTDLSLEYEIMDEIIHLCKTNTVMLFDTVVRLASTVNYEGYDGATYNAFRSYGQVARKILQGDELTIENIVAGYRYDQNGNMIQTSISADRLDKYHAARERKLKIADYILRNAGDDMEFLYLGVDDSTPQTTIQTNEIAYLTVLLGDRGVISAAADELGLCCLARMATILYGKVGIELSYFGPGKDMAADGFDIETLGKNVEKHLVCLNAEQTPHIEGGLQALILTRGYTQADLNALVERIKYNLDNNVPTILLDVTGRASELGRKLFEENDIDVGKLLGYSSWNTAGNAMGIALSLGIGRYTYLRSVECSSDYANEGFLKSLTFGFIKDIRYKGVNASVTGMESESYACSVPLILRKLNASPIITSLLQYKEDAHAVVKASNFRYPWDRTFEMTFDITVG